MDSMKLILPVVVNRFVNRTPDEQQAETLRRAAQAEERRREDRERQIRERRQYLWSRLSQIGSRYANSSWQDWITYGTDDEQAAQLTMRERFECHLRSLPTQVKSGRNLLLFGSRGTGKDFCLATALRHATLSHGISAIWHNGESLYRAFRMAMRAQSEHTEEELVKKLVETPILAISDPLPPTGTLTEFQATTMLGVIDSRYRHSRPCWITVNVASRAELESRMGVLLVDRLLENCDALFYSWPSYREWIRRNSAEQT